LTASLLTSALFLAWSAIGLAAIVALRADSGSLAIVLTAPIVGTCLTVLPLFVLSRAGIDVGESAIPVAVILALLSIAFLVRSRPHLPWLKLGSVLCVCAVALCLTGWPLLDFGFRWLANGNDDMAINVLGALRLLDAPIWAPLDVEELARGVDYATVTALLDVAGVRPGAMLLLAFVQRLTGLTGYEAFMPLMLALHLCGICATGALAAQAARRWWAAVVAGALLAISPLATYGVVQQLLPQIFGLGLACAFVVLLMRRDLHTGRGPRVGDIALGALVLTTLVLSYPEIIPTLAVAYAVYVGVLALRGDIHLRPTLRLWAPVALIVLLTLNVFVLDEIRWWDVQLSRGLSGSESELPLFGYALTPTLLPAIVGLSSFAPDLAENLDPSIAVATALLSGAVVLGLLGTWRGGAAAIVLLVQAGLAGVLYAKQADYGLFKLTMFVQPFLAAAVGAWVANLRQLRWAALGLAGFIPLAIALMSTQRDYVEHSRNPVDVRNASSPAQLPAFRRILAGPDRRPLVSAADNVVLIKLQAASAAGRELRFLTRDVFGAYLEGEAPDLDHPGRREQAKRAQRLSPWRTRAFDLMRSGRTTRAELAEDRAASALLRSGNCLLTLPSGTQTPFNRRHLPEGSPDLIARPCASPRNLLAFIQTSLGQHFYSAGDRSAVSYHQLEPDFFFPGRTISGFGRYALFRVLGPSAGVRLMVDLTMSLRHDGSNRLPPAAAVGAARRRLPMTGRGSARVFSPPLRPQRIAGQSYVMLDMGEQGRLQPVPRHGLERIYGADIPLDTRRLTAYVRDVSLIGEDEFARLRPPSALRAFPADLANPSLEYAGIYEDGWVGESAYAVLSARRGADLSVTGDTRGAERLRVLVGGREVVRRRVPAGRFSVRVPAPVAGRRVRVELRFGSARPLPAPDLRPAAAHLTFLGFVDGSRR